MLFGDFYELRGFHPPTKLVLNLGFLYGYTTAITDNIVHLSSSLFVFSGLCLVLDVYPLFGMIGRSEDLDEIDTGTRFDG